MSKETIIIKLQEIMQEVLNVPDITLSEGTTPDDIEGWDSVVHVQLFAKIEEIYGIKLSLREIMSWETVGELVDIIENKL